MHNIGTLHESEQQDITLLNLTFGGNYQSHLEQVTRKIQIDIIVAFEIHSK